jgi:NADH-quinone oxidoreductase subunit J
MAVKKLESRKYLNNQAVEHLMTPIQIVFIIVAAVTLGSALMVVTSRKVMHSALWLVLALLGVAILFALLDSRFFVVVQVIVYIGAIAILIIFAVMLTRQAMGDQGSPLNRYWWVGALVAALFLASLIGILSTWSGFTTRMRTVAQGGEDLVALGQSFVDPSGYLIPFEVASVLLLAALIGAVYVALERRGEKK